jgi:hypothetical protein
MPPSGVRGMRRQADNALRALGNSLREADGAEK